MCVHLLEGKPREWSYAKMINTVNLPKVIVEYRTQSAQHSATHPPQLNLIWADASPQVQSQRQTLVANLHGKAEIKPHLKARGSS